MTFEIAIATMHKTKEQCLEMLKAENIHCNCIVVNQCDIDDYEEETVGNQYIRIYFTKERGLSKSRNMALRNMKADVMAIGDDDLYYYDGFDKTILSYYEKNPMADVVLFNMDDCYKTFSDKSRKCFFFELSGYKSVQTTFKGCLNGKELFQSVLFNEYFGTGSSHVQSGEENIFLAELWRAGAKIFYCKDKIVKREACDSSWFKGYTESYFKDRGAIYWAISTFWYWLYAFRFAMKIRKKIKAVDFIKLLHFMHEGKTEYKNYLRKNANKVSVMF